MLHHIGIMLRLYLPGRAIIDEQLSLQKIIHIAEQEVRVFLTEFSGYKSAQQGPGGGLVQFGRAEWDQVILSIREILQHAQRKRYPVHIVCTADMVNT